jgi:hypothetical protein
MREGRGGETDARNSNAGIFCAGVNRAAIYSRRTAIPAIDFPFRDLFLVPATLLTR